MNINRRKKHSNYYPTPFTAAVICFFFFSLSSPTAYAQDFYNNSDSGNSAH